MLTPSECMTRYKSSGSKLKTTKVYPREYNKLPNCRTQTVNPQRVYDQIQNLWLETLAPPNVAHQSLDPQTVTPQTMNPQRIHNQILNRLPETLDTQSVTTMVTLTMLRPEALGILHIRCKGDSCSLTR